MERNCITQNTLLFTNLDLVWDLSKNVLFIKQNYLTVVCLINNIFSQTRSKSAGVFGPETMEFLRELGRRLQLVSAEHNSFTYMIQRLSVAVQRGNAASVLGSAGNMDPHDFFEVP